jgi:Protein of unknown function (DUF3180)
VTRDSQLPDTPEDDQDQPEEPQGNLRPTSPGEVAAALLVGLIVGRLVKPLSSYVMDSAPQVGWLPVGLLFFVAAILGYVAYVTHRTIQRRHERLEPHQAVNRLVLAKSCALAGALLTGGYFGYAISWFGQDAELAGQRFWHSTFAGVAGILITAASLFLERACRVRDDDI